MSFEGGSNFLASFGGWNNLIFVEFQKSVLIDKNQLWSWHNSRKAQIPNIFYHIIDLIFNSSESLRNFSISFKNNIITNNHKSFTFFVLLSPDLFLFFSLNFNSSFSPSSFKIFLFSSFLSLFFSFNHDWILESSTS